MAIMAVDSSFRFERMIGIKNQKEFVAFLRDGGGLSIN